MILVFGGPCAPFVPPSWTPLESEGVNGASVRVFRSDQGVTSASSATRWRTGTLSTDVLGGEALDPVDGAGFIRLTSGRLLHIGGAPLGDGATSVSTIRNSDDGGRTWNVLLAHETGPTYTRFRPGHSLGICQTSTHGYVMGGDPIIGGNGEIWRTPLSGDGTVWTLVSTQAWLAARILFMWGVLPDDTIVIAGGQTDVFNAATATANYRSSSDGGLTWTDHGSAPWTARGIIAGPMPVFSIAGTDELVMVGGGRYDSTEGYNVFYDDVWSYNGSTWTERLATGHGQFTAQRYHSVVAHNSRLWLFTGATAADADTEAVYTSTALGTWTAATVSTAHGGSHARAVISTPDGILYDNGFQPGTPPQNLFVIREHTGALASAWLDQGADGLTLLQASDALKPILDTEGFSDRAGIVGTRGQIMTLAAPDRDIAAGIFEAYVILKTLNFDVGNDQGPNAHATIVGNQTGSTWNNFGLSGGQLNFDSAAPTTSTIAGSGVNDDAVHVIGVQFTSESSGTSRLYIDGTLVSTVTGRAFSTSWTGWDSVLAGYLGDDESEAVLGAVVVVRDHTVPLDDTFRTNLQTWAAEWGE